MAWGFFKKTVVADRLGEYVDAVFNDPSAADAGNIWLALIFFGVQIYADFSGYSDIALGSARCMGFDLVINFNRPYFFNKYPGILEAVAYFPLFLVQGLCIHSIGRKQERKGQKKFEYPPHIWFKWALAWRWLDLYRMGLITWVVCGGL